MESAGKIFLQYNIRWDKNIKAKARDMTTTAVTQPKYQLREKIPLLGLLQSLNFTISLKGVHISVKGVKQAYQAHL
jgi:hypothetical protein